MIPTWLQRHLEATGRANPDGVGRRLRATTCRGCGATVLRGLDADRVGLVATVQPTPVSVLGEVQALVAGKATWDLYAVPRLELHPREHWHIQGQRRRPVMAAHRCHVIWPADDQPTPTPTREDCYVPPF